jgi:hypothetical protein
MRETFKNAWRRLKRCTVNYEETVEPRLKETSGHTSEDNQMPDASTIILPGLKEAKSQVKSGNLNSDNRFAIITKL